MLNKFCKKPLYEVTRTMARVAMGVQKAETVIKNARLISQGYFERHLNRLRRQNKGKTE